MFNHFNISEITTITKGELSSFNNENAVVNYLLTDSRKLGIVNDCMFVALTSKKNDGHNYIAALYKKGIVNYMVEKLPEDIENYKKANFVVVKSTLEGLQKIAAAHRAKFTIPVVGITGSNGKTIIKEWLAMLLESDHAIVKSPKSYNSQVGVPLSVWEMQPEHNMAIFEAGISEPGEMEHLEAIIRPTIGIFANIGTAHDEYFLNRTQKIAEKLRLFVKSNAIIYCADHSEIRERMHGLESFREVRHFTWGTKHSDVDLFVSKLTVENQTTSIDAVYKEQSLTLKIPFTDAASIENAMHCWAFMLYIGYEQKVIAERMALLSAVEMRMNLKEGINNCTIINDSYSSDFNSLQIAIDFLNQQKSKKNTVILSDIYQSGRNENELYQDLADLLEKKNVQRLIGIGTAISRQADKFTIEKEFFPDTDTFLKQFHFSEFGNETILLKGARVFQFERINHALQKKAHETVLEVNLNALEHNLNYIKSKLHPTTKVMAMVKAFAYGAGAYEIANWLQFHNVDYITVAFPDEGVELRKNGLTMPIMVMNTEEHAIDNLFKYNLEPEVFNFRGLNMLIEKLDYHTAEAEIKIHIKLDTGMHRLGFMEDEINQLLKQLHQHPKIIVASVFSHLAASDNNHLDDFTHKQLAEFDRLSSKIVRSFDYPILRHILNSGGIIRFTDAQFDMVRMGITLYGIGYNETEQQKLIPVSTLKTTISQIKTIPANDTVGYNCAFVASESTTIGIIPIGYADGFDRRLSNGVGEVMVNGKIVPIVGSVCMDMCMIDLTGIEAHEGDEVLIFGEKLLITKMAEKIGTIPYEILTGISNRVKRVYYQE